MTFAELHLAVRETLRGTALNTFLVGVESVEDSPGRVDVEWRIYVPREPTEALYFKGRDPFRLLAALRLKLREVHPPEPVPSALTEVGESPSDDPTTEPR